MLFDLCLEHSFAANWKASSEIRKISSEDAEGFFQRPFVTAFMSSEEAFI